MHVPRQTTEFQSNGKFKFCGINEHLHWFVSLVHNNYLLDGLNFRKHEPVRFERLVSCRRQRKKFCSAVRCSEPQLQLPAVSVPSSVRARVSVVLLQDTVLRDPSCREDTACVGDSAGGKGCASASLWRVLRRLHKTVALLKKRPDVGNDSKQNQQ